jgi:hypothetical protein
MARRSYATNVGEAKLEPVTVDGEIVARRGVGARFKVEVDGQTIELMICGPNLEAVRAACDAFNIEHDPKHSGEVLMVRPSFFAAKVQP